MFRELRASLEHGSVRQVPCVRLEACPLRERVCVPSPAGTLPPRGLLHPADQAAGSGHVVSCGLRRIVLQGRTARTRQVVAVWRVPANGRPDWGWGLAPARQCPASPCFLAQGDWGVFSGPACIYPLWFCLFRASFSGSLAARRAVQRCQAASATANPIAASVTGTDRQAA